MVPSAMASRQTSWVPGRMMQRTSGCTCLPRRMLAAWRRSAMRPLVQLPMTTWSMAMPAQSAAAAVLLGRCGLLTVGCTAEASISRTRAYSASRSLANTLPAVRARLPSGRLWR